MNEPKYRVVWPLGRSVFELVPPKSRLADLNGRTICELSDWSFKADEIFPLLREALRKRFPGVRLVDYNVVGNIHGTRAAEIVASIPAKLRENGCDGVIAGVGG